MGCMLWSLISRFISSPNHCSTVCNMMLYCPVLYNGTWLCLAETIIEFHLFRRVMMTSSNGKIFRVTGLLCGEFTFTGEFPSQRTVMQSFNVFFDLRLNKRLSKQSWGWWFEMPSRSLWRHCNGNNHTWPPQVGNCSHHRVKLSSLCR